MKDKSINIFNSIFSVFILLAIIGGGIVFLLFIVAFIVGGESATVFSTAA